MRLSCYIHVPFCARICTYCDFYRIVHDQLWETRYIDAICSEMDLRFTQLRKARFDNRLDTDITLETVFLGGGTPTVLSAESWSRLVTRLKTHAQLSPDVEFTSEANPESSTPDKLALLRSLGVNRLSFGAQSFNAANLQRLGRLHTAGQTTAAVAAARAAGFDNLSLDLMYGLPDESESSFNDDLQSVVKLGPQHISCYSLMLEGNVPLRYQVERREVPLPSDDLVADRYQRAVAYLAECGFEHYEISNYARSGYHCRHNCAYWLQQDYIGFGPAAVGTIGDRRYKNEPDIFRYVKNLSQGILPVADDEHITPGKRLVETIMLSLRLRQGLDVQSLATEFQYDIMSVRRDLIVKLQDEGDISNANGRLCLSTKGMFRADMIASSLLPEIV